MGTFTWPLHLTGMDGEHSVDVEATVDTGALYTMLPTRTLNELGTAPIDSRTFLIADGSSVAMEVGQAWVTVDGVSIVTIVAFGGDNAPPVLGAYTLEGLGAGRRPRQAEACSRPANHAVEGLVAARSTLRQAQGERVTVPFALSLPLHPWAIHEPPLRRRFAPLPPPTPLPRGCIL